MRDRKTLIKALQLRLSIHERMLKRLRIPKRKVLLTRVKGQSVMQVAQNYHARIPQHMKALQKGGADALRAAFAIGRFEGIRKTTVEFLEKDVKQAKTAT